MHDQATGSGIHPAGMVLSQARIDHEAKIGNWPDRILTEYFEKALAENSEKIAIVADRADQEAEIILNYADLDDRVSRIAANLTSLGIGKGDVVSIQLPNWWEFVAIHLACLRIGAISNPLMPIFRARELEYMVSFAESRILIVPKFFQKFDHEALGNQLLKEISTLEHVFVVGGDGANSFENALLGTPVKSVPPHSPLHPNDVVQLLYTSGTTGRPKGVMHTSNTLIASAKHVAQRLQLNSTDSGFMPAPFAHQIGFCFGITMTIYLGIPLVMMDVWNPEIAVKMIEHHRTTYTCASTPFMADLANVPNVEQMDMDCFRMFMTAGAPVIEQVIEDATRTLKVQVVPGWGMTEVIQATATEPMSMLTGPLTDGAAFPGIDVRIIDDDGLELPTGQDGNLQCRGSTLFVGYFKKPELYDVDDQGWFDTGDLARMDEDGNIRIAGRLKDIIIRGGENIPVQEVENLIYQIPEVREVALVPMPDERLGERGCAFVTLQKEAHLTFDTLVSFLESKDLARQYFPERLETIDEMPRTSSGKIQKFILREHAAKLAAKSVEKLAKDGSAVRA